jgi:hypothetical protein
MGPRKQGFCAPLPANAALRIGLSTALLAQDKFAQPRDHAQVGYLTDGTKGREPALSGTDASQLEKQLMANPEDEAVRAKFLGYYSTERANSD